MKEQDSVGRSVLGPIPAQFDAAWVIRRAHELGAEGGFERVRIDRGQDPQTGRYYEAGYGPLKIVTLVGSIGTVLRFTAETWKPETAEDRIREFLRAVKESVA